MHTKKTVRLSVLCALLAGTAAVHSCKKEDPQYGMGKEKFTELSAYDQQQYTIAGMQKFMNKKYKLLYRITNFPDGTYEVEHPDDCQKDIVVTLPDRLDELGYKAPFLNQFAPDGACGITTDDDDLRFFIQYASSNMTNYKVFFNFYSVIAEDFRNSGVSVVFYMDPGTETNTREDFLTLFEIDPEDCRKADNGQKVEGRIWRVHYFTKAD